ncbi:hypothetical protein ANTQUA_LOCUS4885 [Anthophora quadrimaculata]
MRRPISLNVELFYDKNVLSWSKRLLSLSGLWPDNHNDVRFFFYITYVVIFTWLEIVTLLQNIHDLEKSLKNITLSFPTILIVLKAVMFRLNMHLVLPLLEAVRKDVKEGLYQSQEERRTVVWYSVAATLFSTSSVMSLFFVPTLFYTKPIVSCLLSSKFVRVISISAIRDAIGKSMQLEILICSFEHPKGEINQGKLFF